jgi:hypothetical protein
VAGRHANPYCVHQSTSVLTVVVCRVCTGVHQQGEEGSCQGAQGAKQAGGPGLQGTPNVSSAAAEAPFAYVWCMVQQHLHVSRARCTSRSSSCCMRWVHSAAVVDVAVAYVACMVRCAAVLAGAGSCSVLYGQLAGCCALAGCKGQGPPQQKAPNVRGTSCCTQQLPIVFCLL